LISTATGVNYQPLQEALAARDLRLADQITETLMLRATGRESEGFFRDEDLNNFACEDLRLVDELWLEYSDGKFGISVQQEIYASLGGNQNYERADLRRFGDQVGWRNGLWITDADVDYSESAPKGYFPRYWILGGWSLSNFLVLGESFGNIGNFFELPRTCSGIDLAFD
jgi:hypothetical protein